MNELFNVMKLLMIFVIYVFKNYKERFGAYQCIAENLLGKEEWTYQIVSRGNNNLFCIILNNENFFLKVNGNTNGYPCIRYNLIFF